MRNPNVIIAFVSYVLLEQISEDIGPPLEVFRQNQQKLVDKAVAKFDAGKVDDGGHVRLGPGDIDPLTWPRD